MFPTLASLVEERLKDDPELIHDVIHALNEWMYETWQFNYEDRSSPSPSSPCHCGPRPRGTRVVPGARRRDRAGPARADAGLRGTRSFGTRSSTRSGRPACKAGHPRVDARLRQRLFGVPQRLGARPTSSAVRADRVPDGRDGQAAHRGLDGRAGLPRRADPQPGPARPSSIENGADWVPTCSSSSRTFTRRCPRFPRRSDRRPSSEAFT